MVDAEGRLRGVISRGDLLKVFLRTDADIAGDVRRVAAEHFPGTWQSVEVRVHEGVVTLGGLVHDTSAVPLVARLVRTVEGVVDVGFDIRTGSAGLTHGPGSVVLSRAVRPRPVPASGAAPRG